MGQEQPSPIFEKDDQPIQIEPNPDEPELKWLAKEKRTFDAKERLAATPEGELDEDGVPHLDWSNKVKKGYQKDHQQDSGEQRAA